MPGHAWKTDNKLTAMMVEDMQFDPILAAKVILGLRIPPHEELRILWMWTTYHTNDDSGFSTGKSFTFAIVSALRSILFPNRTSGVLSKTFAQGKLIFKNYDRWYNSSKIFRHCVATQGGKPRMLHNPDAFEVYFKGGSLIRVLPPSFHQDAERLRGERWNDGYFDEWTVYGNFEAFNTTIVGRVTKENEYQDCPVRQNHIHMASTPNFTHHPSYKIIRRIQRNIRAGNLDYGRFTCNYRHLPKTKEWRWLINRKVIFTMQTTLPAGVVKSEIDGVWQEDSLSYYSSKAISLVRQQVELAVKRLRGDDVFVAGFDTARGNDRSGNRSGDDFAITVLKRRPSLPAPQHCLTIRRNNISADQMGAIIHEVHRNIQLSVLVYDTGGGGAFVADSLKKHVQKIRNVDTLVVPIIDPFTAMGVIGDPILQPFVRRNMFIAQKWGKMAADSTLVNRLHQDFKGAIENGNVELAPEWHGWQDTRSQWDLDSKRSFLNTATGLSELDRLKAEMDLAVEQLILVDVKRDANGTPIMDSHGMYKFGSKEKKDSAYSLIYAWMGSLILDIMGYYNMSPNGIDNSELAMELGEL